MVSGEPSIAAARRADTTSAATNRSALAVVAPHRYSAVPTGTFNFAPESS
jgi:hypothetical protein